MLRTKRGDVLLRTYQEGGLYVYDWEWTTDAATPGVAQPRESVEIRGQLWLIEYAHFVTGATGTWQPKLIDESGSNHLSAFTALATLAVNAGGKVELFQEVGLGIRPFVLPPVWLQVTMSTAGVHAGRLKLRTRPEEGL